METQTTYLAERYRIVHQTPGRLRLKFDFPLTASICQTIEEWLLEATSFYKVKWFKRTQSVILEFPPAEKEALLTQLDRLDGHRILTAYHHPIEDNVEIFDIFRDELLAHYLTKWLIPLPIRSIRNLYHSFSYIKQALVDLRDGKFSVDVLDATAIVLSFLRNDFETAGSIMFLLQLSDKLEHHTRRKSYDDLKQSLALSINKVWQVVDGKAVEVATSSIQVGDIIIVNRGNMVPFDGQVVEGSGVVNESSLTGEAFPIRKASGDAIYANTVLEEGEVQFKVTSTQTDTAIAKLVDLINQSESTKSAAQRTLEQQADGLVKYNFLGAILTYLLTGNINRALTFLLVDFSCALRLIGPLTYLTAIKDATDQGAVVKGSKFIENFADIDTFIFDKTGTLTDAVPTVVDTISFNDYTQEEVIRIAACLEEHYHHPIAAAIVQTAIDQNISHEEMHADLNYIVAHGIESAIDGKRVVIGSRHFILEDEAAYYDDHMAQIIAEKEKYYNLLYLAYDNELIAIFVIDTRVRPETKETLRRLKNQGKKIVLLTGDQTDRAQSFAKPFNFDTVLAQLLPEEKYAYIQNLQAKGHKVAMIGDGINDSAALSLADVGIVMKESSDLARQVSDVVLLSDQLTSLFTLQDLSQQLKRRLQHSYRFIIGFNSLLIAGGVFSLLSNTGAAMLHNTSTVATALLSAKSFPLDKELALKSEPEDS